MAIAKIECWERHPSWDMEVSTPGRVRVRGRIRKATLHHSGYLVVTLHFGGPQRALHTLVLETFRGPRPKGKECRHLDGDKQNCRLPNLKWGTKRQNLADQKKHGTYARPPVQRKYPPSTYRDIFRRLSQGATVESMVQHFGVSRGAIYRQMKIEGVVRGRI